ncbi:HAD family hydrolase [uncultured Selenomonas sp.]|uniref:HAD family hydrolase n=1 Tax=uncultured Selenomonas sp. TaxID=159275 RepID=UPI0025E35911|nr:HAD hydrolase-like protein [uncultured Selenomonas sp.]
MYRLYLFDFDYTLVNSEQGILGCFHRTIDAWHLPSVTDDTIRKTIGLPMEQAVEIITGITDASEIDRFIDDYRKDADIHMTPGTHFFPDTLPTRKIRRRWLHGRHRPHHRLRRRPRDEALARRHRAGHRPPRHGEG